MRPSLLIATNIEEQLLKINQERSILLAMAEEISLARTKGELLLVINDTLKKLFSYDDGVVCLMNDDQQTHSAFLYNQEEIFAKYPGSETMADMRFSINDGIFDSIANTPDVIIIELDEAIKLPNAAFYVSFWIEQGMKQLIGVPLKKGATAFGTFSFYTKQRNSIIKEQFSLLYSICSHVSIAIQNIVANELNEKNSFEKSVLLEICNALSLTKERIDIAKVIHSKIGKLLSFDKCILGIIDPCYCKFHSFSFEHNAAIEFGNSFFLAKEVLLSSESKALLSAIRFPERIDFTESSGDNILKSFFNEIMLQEFREGVIVSVFEGKKLIGYLALSSKITGNYHAKDLNLLEGIGSQLSSAAANILAKENIKKQEKEKTFLLSFSNRIVTVRDLKGLKLVLKQSLKDLFHIKTYIITVKNKDNESSTCFLYDFPGIEDLENKFETLIKTKLPIKGSLANIVLNGEDPVVFDLLEVVKTKKLIFPEYPFWQAARAEKIMGIRLRVANEDIGILWLEAGHINNRLLMGISAQIAIALSNAISNASLEKQFEEIQNYKRKLEVENNYLQEEIGIKYDHSEIVGNSAEMQKVFHLLSQVAYANTTVLLLGETGTGKELVARAVHNTSPRKDKLMVKVNCAAFPPNLIESELFGHEKGSFTGAYEQKIGKFELAHNGTLFLDEVGEMPLDLQVKILRALQEREIERVGGKKIIKINVRVIAATNRDLQKEVIEGRFRSDLYYRLNVFPINMPTLRSRKEDIPLLVDYFIVKLARRTGKNVKSIAAKALQELMDYSWPGNIRELEHMIERSLLLSHGNVIKNVHLPTNKKFKPFVESCTVDKTIDENEREHIIKILRKCNGKIFGKGAAADILGVPPSTLNSKMKKLNIKKNNFFNND